MFLLGHGTLRARLLRRQQLGGATSIVRARLASIAVRFIAQPSIPIRMARANDDFYASGDFQDIGF
jgi:hypothetical protein